MTPRVNSHQTDALIRLALQEDIGTGDQTTLATIEPDVTTRGVVLAKSGLVLAGMPFFVRTFELVDSSVEVTTLVPEGTWVDPGETVATVAGSTRAILSAERTALNILQRLCGVATLTRRYADALAGTSARVTDTRKTTPGMRVMQKYAVRMGGGVNHRMGLDSGILIKDNHIAACGSLRGAVERARQGSPHLLRVEVEAATLDEVDEALHAGADVIMLDNMTVEMMTEAVERVRSSGRAVLIELSGSLSLDKLRQVASTGVDLLSVGALTHSAPAADLSLDLQ